MKQRVVVAKVAGEAAASIWQQLIVAEIMVREDRGRPYIAKLGERLRCVEMLPPILFFCEYYDYWSSGFLFDQLTKSEEKRWARVADGESETFGYRLPDNDFLLTLLQEKACSAATDEDSWFYVCLCHAIKSWAGLNLPSILLVTRAIVGVTITDDEVLASANKLPRWVINLSSK